MKRFRDDYNKEILEIVKQRPSTYANFIRAKYHRPEIAEECGKTSHQYLYKYVLETTNDILPKNAEFSLRVFFVLNKLEEFPRCKTCGKPLTNMANTKFRLKFVDGKLQHQIFCSGRCRMKNPETIAKLQKILEEKYGKGIINSFQAEECKEKARQTKIEKYGDPEYRNFDKIAETNLKKYGVKNVFASSKIKEKIVQINIQKYGVKNGQQSHEIRKKMRRKYYYDGQRFDSSWEVAFYIFHKDKGSVLKHEPENLTYFDSKGILHKYFPDFKIGNVYYDMKGNQFFNKDGTPTKENEDKYNFMKKIGVIIVREKDMKQYFDCP